MLFFGTYEHSIDAKNRLAIPSEIRAHIVDELRRDQPDVAAKAGKSAEPSVFLYVMLGDGQTLSLYTEKVFAQRAEQLDNSELDADQLLAFERLLYSQTQRVELDKQGRIRLPESLLSMVKLGSEVVVIGVKDHLEIHDRETWRSHVEQMRQQPGNFMNPRRAMRKPG